MVHNYRASPDFIRVYTSVIEWHLYAIEPSEAQKKVPKSVARKWWPQQYPTGEEPSAFSRGNLHRVPLLKRKYSTASTRLLLLHLGGSKAVPTYLQFDYPFNKVFEPSNEPRPEPLGHPRPPRPSRSNVGGRIQQPGLGRGDWSGRGGYGAPRAQASQEAKTFNTGAPVQQLGLDRGG